MKEADEQEFCCPPVTFPRQSEDFYIPECPCPDRLPQLQLPSPNTCLPEDVHEELELRIRAANQFLLRSALSGREERNEIFRRSFEGLIGQKVVVFLGDAAEEEEAAIVDGGDETIENSQTMVSGRVFLAGRDFTLLRQKGKQIIVPNERISKIKLSNRFAEPLTEEQLRDIDPVLRRCLTFRFGEVVSSSPELIHLFFKIPLKVFLLQFIDKKLIIQLEDENMAGDLFDVDGDSLTIRHGSNKRTLPIADAVTFMLED